MARNEGLRLAIAPGGAILHYIREGRLALCGVSAEWEHVDARQRDLPACETCLNLLTMRVDKDATHAILDEMRVAADEYVLTVPKDQRQSGDKAADAKRFLEWIARQPSVKRNQWQALSRKRRAAS